MIRGMHGMFYSSKADELRAFLRDKLKLPHTDVGEGWLIFDVPEADLGVHPTSFPDSLPSGTHYLSFYCDDIQKPGRAPPLTIRSATGATPGPSTSPCPAK